MPTTTDRPRVVLVTGASSGIGLACAERLHAAGFRVYGASRHPPPAGRAGRGGFETIAMDVTSDESVQRAVDGIASREGRLDVVVNNAGYGLAGAVEFTQVEEAREQFETNFFGVLRVCRAVLPLMRANGGGYLVNVSSIAGLMGLPFEALYSASKFAVEGFTEALRAEVAPHGIRVVLIEPGDCRTAFTERRQVARAARGAAPYAERQRLAMSIMERDETAGADPDTVARLVERVIATASPRARYTCGPFWQRVAISLKRLLPSRVFEFAVATYYRLR
jgi:NAD(P)-dependent dehydrogenase (short-subunit alcohol dehydrogenase family)